MDQWHRRRTHLLRLWQRRDQDHDRHEILEAAVQHDRDEADAARVRLLRQAAGIPAAPTSRVYVSASRDPSAPLLTRGQAARGHGGRS